MPLIASFLHRAFIAPNQRLLMQSDLAEALEDELFTLRERAGDGMYPKTALDYLNDWADPEKGWLRKFYRQGVDEPCFDLTPATEKAIVWLGSLTERSFVGTESRLLTLFELLRQMSTGTEADPEVRIEELRRRRDEIDAAMERVRSGDLPLLDDTALKDRFQQFMQMAQELLADFREVEQNFRSLDRRTRERIALWEGSKGELLKGIMKERDFIADSDQGRSFQAFWDFLMSSARQEELTRLLEHVLALDAVAGMNPPTRTRRVHYDWLEACEHTQRTVARLSAQLRRFLDDRVWLENRRIMGLLQGIETKALELRQSPPRDAFMYIAGPAADVRLPMERPLYRPSIKPLIADVELEAGGEDVDASALFAQVPIDKPRLARHVRNALQNRSQSRCVSCANSILCSTDWRSWWDIWNSPAKRSARPWTRLCRNLSLGMAPARTASRLCVRLACRGSFSCGEDGRTRQRGRPAGRAAEPARIPAQGRPLPG